MTVIISGFYLKDNIIASFFVGSFKIPDINTCPAQSASAYLDCNRLLSAYEQFLVHAPYCIGIAICFETPKRYLAGYTLLVGDRLARRAIRRCVPNPGAL